MDATEQRQIEERLARSEHKYRTLFDYAGDAIFVRDLEGRCLDVNQCALELYGYSRTELLAMMPGELNASGLSQELHHPDLLKTKGRIIYETEHRTRDGRAFPVEVLATLVDFEGQPCMLTFVRDVRRRKEAEESLFASQTRMELALGGADLVIWEVDLPSGQLWLNRQSAELLGYPLDENGQYATTRRELYLPADVARVEAAWRDYAAGKTQRFEMELQLRTNSGAMRWVVVRGRHTKFDEHGRPVRAMGTYHDIDRLKRTALDLRIKDSAIHSARDAIAFATLEGRIFYTNPAFLHVFRYATVVGMQVGEFGPFPDPNADALRGLMPPKQGESEFMACRADGTVFPARISSSVVRDEAGEPLCIVGFFHDLSEQKRAQKEIMTLREREQERIAQELHDCLGQELTGIALFSKALEQGLAAQQRPEAAAAAKITSLVNRAIGQLRAMIKDFYPAQLAALGLDSYLRQLSFDLQEQYPALVCQFEAAAPEIIRDPAAGLQLYFIAKEASHNAAKHGRVRRITIRLDRQKGRPRLEVADDGAGFDLEKKVGQGMGLLIMQHRATLINAELVIGPNERGGVTVTCLMPEEQ